MTEKEMPRYRSHKEVHALKIASVTEKGTDTTTDENPIVVITFDDVSFAPLTINLRGKPTPEDGWYYIVYEDGYTSFSPATAFEEGYTITSLIPATPSTLAGKIALAINCHSKEQGSDTPDFILADFLLDCLRGYDTAVRARARWYGRTPDGQAKPSA